MCRFCKVFIGILCILVAIWAPFCVGHELGISAAVNEWWEVPAIATLFGFSVALSFIGIHLLSEGAS